MPPVLQRFAGLIDRSVLRMGKSVPVSISPIIASANDPVLIDDHTTNRHLAQIVGLFCLL